MHTMENECSKVQRLSPQEVMSIFWGLLRPNKRNAFNASVVGAALLLIQCFRASYLPEFDWATGAGAVVLIAVLGFTLLLVMLITTIVGMPGLIVTTQGSDNTPEPVRLKHETIYLGMIILFTAGLAVFSLILIGASYLKTSIVGVFMVTASPYIFIIYIIALLLISTRRQVHLNHDHKWHSILAKLLINSFGMLLSTCVYYMLLVILDQYRVDNLIDVFSIIAFPLILVISINALVIFRPRNPLPYKIAALVLLMLFSVTLSDAAFAHLGLGNRDIEFVLKETGYAEALRAAGIEPIINTTKYRARMRLRLGKEIVLSKGSNESFSEAHPVSIPRDAIFCINLLPEKSNSKTATP